MYVNMFFTDLEYNVIITDWSWVGEETIYCESQRGISRGWGMFLFKLADTV